MADIGNHDQHDGIQEDLNQPDDAAPAKARTGWTGWLISGSFHALMLLIMYGVYWVVKAPETETSMPRTTMIDPPEKKQEKPKDREVIKQVTIKIESDVDSPSPMNQSELQPTIAETQDDNDLQQPKGREEAVAQSEMGGESAFMAIAAGSSASGAYGLRGGGGHKAAVGRGGGSRESEAAVDAALRWFKRHQSPSGMWDAVNYYKNCTIDQKCEPGAETHGGPASYDVAMTGYALLCFLGRGYTHQVGTYRQVVKRGLDYLLAVQKPDGYFGERNYENAIATMAICEALAMSDDASLRAPAQKAVDQIVAHQNKDLAAAANPETSAYGSGLGWDYAGPGNRNDSSVSGWNVMALKDALSAGLNIGNSLDGAKNWLTTVWKKQNPDWARIDAYHGESRFPYTFLSDTGATQIAPAPAAGAAGPSSMDLTCVGGLCAVFLGHQAGDVMLESMANYVSKHYLPTSWPPNIYYMYYNTTTMFQVGGERWKTWNGSVREILVKAQRKSDNCFDGSWDWKADSFIGGDTGRVLTTAYSTLCLEVYYRYNKENGHL